METIQKAIEVLAKRISATTSQDEALKFTQAALNLANTMCTLGNTRPLPAPVVTDAMVTRFLGWQLPPTFAPDAGINFAPSNGMSREEAYGKAGWWPVGTNLLTADEARAMLEHVLAT